MKKSKRRLMTLTELALELGVDRRQVWAWAARAARNGFPAPVRTIERLGRTVNVWDFAEVSEWHLAYVPSVGGRPRNEKASA